MPGPTLKLRGVPPANWIVPVAKTPVGLVMWIVSAFTPGLALSYQENTWGGCAWPDPPPPNSTEVGPFGPLLTKDTVAFRTPLSVGVNVIWTVQVPAGAMFWA